MEPVPAEAAIQDAAVPRVAAVLVGGRDLGIDRFRGALVWLMVAGNLLGGIAAVPDVIKHTPDIGLSVADLVAPAFVFAMGINLGPSFRRRLAADGAGAAYGHFVLRDLALLGIGTIISAGGGIVGQATSWGVLQALGEAGLIALVVIRLNAWWRFAIGTALLVGYQLILDAWALEGVLGAIQGGFIGGLSWGALLVLSTAIADLWRRGIGQLAAGTAIVAAVAVLAALLVPVSKNRVSLSYVLVTLAIASAAFLLTELATQRIPRRAGYLAWWGENPLALYLLHLLVLGLVTLPPIPGWYRDAPLWLAGVQLLVVMTVLSLAAWWLHRRRVRLRL